MKLVTHQASSMLIISDRSQLGDERRQFDSAQIWSWINQPTL